MCMFNSKCANLEIKEERNVLLTKMKHIKSQHSKKKSTFYLRFLCKTYLLTLFYCCTKNKEKYKFYTIKILSFHLLSIERNVIDRTPVKNI